MAASALNSITLTRDSENDVINEVIKPEYLYAYTDPNVSGETLYAWGPTSNGSTFSKTGRYYTKTLTPTTSDKLYDENGNELTITIMRDYGSYTGYPELIGINDNSPTTK